MRKHAVLTSILASCLFLVVGSEAYADPFTFDTLPLTGNVSGAAGTTVGWGYTLTNESLTDWLVTTSLSADSFLHGTPTALFDLPILAPDTTVSVPLDVLNGLGLYALTWDATAPTGFTNTGTFLLSAEWWDADPLAGGHFLNVALDQSAAYSALVTSDTTAVPEPTSLVLLGIGCVMLTLRKKLSK